MRLRNCVFFVKNSFLPVDKPLWSLCKTLLKMLITYFHNIFSAEIMSIVFEFFMQKIIQICKKTVKTYAT